MTAPQQSRWVASPRRRSPWAALSFTCAAFALLLFAACNQPKPADPQEPKPSAKDSLCGHLDTLMRKLEAFYTVVPDADWGELEPALADLTQHLRRNIDARDDSCSFFNLKLYPDVDRFGFIELLKMRITEDSISQGILYLIKLRGTFCVDKEITEFMSEEMAHVAADNPTVFLRYYHDNPGQQELLLHSTRWHNSNLDSLIPRFRRLPEGEPVAQYLTEWQQNRLAIPDR